MSDLFDPPVLDEQSDTEQGAPAQASIAGTVASSVIEKLRAGIAQLRLANPLSELSLGTGAIESLLVVPTDPWPGDTATGTELVQGIFRLGGQMI